MNKTKIKKLPDINRAKEILREYKQNKSELEQRLRREERLWKNVYSSDRSSSWIFNSIVNKHADIIDNIPDCTCLPREKCDEEYAAVLSKVIPVITERAGFEQTYSDNSWDKLKHGTAVYGVFWNPMLEGGLGDIEIKPVKISDIYFEPGVSDIQDSSDLFIVSFADVGKIEALYSHFKYEENRASDSAVSSMLGSVSVNDDRCAVIDWYYKRFDEYGKSEVQLCKFVGDCILYSSEADENCPFGWYEHGQYPIVTDRLYPCNDGVCGFGIISIAENAQNYINRIDENLLSYSDWASRVRFWAKRSLGVNEKEFLDLDHSIVEVEGDIDEEKLRQIEITPIDDSVIDVKRLKIDEIKEITGSRDVSQGGVTGGVTAASAISILREAGAKSSRDGIEETYRAYVKIITLVIELIAQFYSSSRIFRIVGDDGYCQYLSFSGKALRENDSGRRPHFDIEINASKRSPSEAEQKNQFAKELYDAGAFKKENAKETLIMLELMNFDGVGKLRSAIKREYGYDGEN